MKTNLKTEYLTCPSCIKKIETGVGKTKGVTDVNVKFNLNKVTGEYLKNKIEKSGHRIKSVKTSA